MDTGKKGKAVLEATDIFMTKVVVDSDIIIDFLRTGSGFLPKLFTLQRDGNLELFISTITVLELFAGKSSKKITKELRELISGFIIVPVGEDLAMVAGILKRDYKVNAAFADLVVGATSLSLGAKLATRNRRHYQGIPKLQFYPLS